ncbi:MAG: 7-carboxy-7-deazaguanine synthase QueE [Verrucomicrobiota bacterium]
MKLARMPDGSPEIFYTLQGEGRNVGRPSIFLRTSLCNLHCSWCDTDYTWNWEGTRFDHEQGKKYRREEQIVELSIKEIIEEVEQYPCRNFVFTGGEPLIHDRDWTALMESLSGSFEVETNGTLFPSPGFLERIHQMNVSPKLSNSGIDPSLRIKPEVLRKLGETGKADFKFVVGDQSDFDEIQLLMEKATLPQGRIFLMPKANSVSELEENQGFVSELAQENGFHYSDRLHLRLFGAKRGV